ncbi:hypothetical protein PGB90_003818 [Kerria lacca]
MMRYTDVADRFSILTAYAISIHVILRSSSSRVATIAVFVSSQDVRGLQARGLS